MNATLLLVVSCVLLACLSCPSETQGPRSQTRGGSKVVIFLTGNELGSLRPCGCSGGQLGGIEKRLSVFDRISPQRRMVIDTGNLSAGDGEQDLIKFGIFWEAFKLLKYDLVCLTSQDLVVAEHLGLLSSPQQAFGLVEDREGAFQVSRKRFPDLGLTVNVAAFDSRTTPAEDAANLFATGPGGSALNILILRDADRGLLLDLIAKSKGIDCIIFPSDADEPHILSEAGATPLVITVGRLGRYVGRLMATIPTQGARPVLEYGSIPVVEDLPDDAALVQLYKRYQQLVSAANLLENYPRFPLPDDLTFTGSESCKGCHSYEYGMWSEKSHAIALDSLRKVGSDRDPECVICHVIGMEYESGYISETRTPHLKDVGCENCHGPGSEHVKSFGKTATREPKMSCLACHTAEKSAGYAGHEEEYMEKIKHWREPAAAGNVKD